MSNFFAMATSIVNLSNISEIIVLKPPADTKILKMQCI